MIPFTDEEIYEAVKNNIPKASQYVNSHGGGIILHGVKDATAYIELTGTCSGCSMSLMTTKMVVQRELQALIHPELNIVNVDGSEQNALPEDAYVEIEEKKGIFDKVKDALHV
jgi:Fe-S cluster biogenesis protein NfuA